MSKHSRKKQETRKGRSQKKSPTPIEPKNNSGKKSRNVGGPPKVENPIKPVAEHDWPAYIRRLEEHYSRLGLSKMYESDYYDAMNENHRAENVIEVGRLQRRYGSRGDDRSIKELHSFLHTATFPTHNITFSEVDDSLCFWLNLTMLPRLTELCTGADTVLDAGCGGGILATYLAAECPETQFVGVDRCIEAVEHCRQRVAQLSLPNLSVETGDVFNLPDSLTGRFDAIILRSVVDETWNTNEENRDYNYAHKLSRLRKGLKEGGQIWFSSSFMIDEFLESLERIHSDIKDVGLAICGYYRFHDYAFIPWHLAFLLCSIDDKRVKEHGVISLDEIVKRTKSSNDEESQKSVGWLRYLCPFRVTDDDRRRFSSE